MAPDAEEMSQKLGLLFGDQYSGFSNLLMPHFLNERIRPNGVLLQHTDDDSDPLEEAGFLLSDGDGVPLLKRLRGIRLDVLKALALWCKADDLVRMIDGEPPEQISPQPAPATATKQPKEQRQAERWQMCIDDGLDMPTDTFAQYPRGIGKVAKKLGIKTQSLRQDLNEHRERIFSL